MVGVQMIGAGLFGLSGLAAYITPRGNLKHDDEVVARHFQLMNHQLAQARPRATSPDLRPARHLATAVPS